MQCATSGAKNIGVLRVEQGNRLNEPEYENTRLRRLVVDSSIANSVSKKAKWVTEERRLACQPFN
jgi:hypothetical protein